jgi:hypothetical protein
MDEKYELLLDNNDLFADIRRDGVRHDKMALLKEKMEQDKNELIEHIKNKENWSYDEHSGTYTFIKNENMPRVNDGKLRSLLQDHFKKEIWYFNTDAHCFKVRFNTETRRTKLFGELCYWGKKWMLFYTVVLVGQFTDQAINQIIKIMEKYE